MTKFEKFSEAFAELTKTEQVALYRDYQREIGDEEVWYDFCEEFFEAYFDDAMEAVRAWHFGGGDKNSWNDEYIHFNAYGNLETASEWQVAKEAKDYVEEIFKHPDLWREYIDDDELDDSDAA